MTYSRTPWRPARRALALLTLLLVVAVVGSTLGLVRPSGWLGGGDALAPGPETATEETEPEQKVQASPPGTLPAMLALAPNRLDDDLPLADVATYADIAAATRAHGLAWPVDRTDPSLAAWESSLDALALPPALAARGLDPAWEATYGFSLLQSHQVLTVGQAPDTATIIHGDFDVAALNAAWVRSGYQAVEAEGATVWSLFPGDTIDLSAPASRPALGSFNNVYLLDERTLVAAPKLSLMREVLRVAQGTAPSLAEQPEVAALLAPVVLVESLVTAMLVEGQLFQAAQRDEATPTSPVPRVELALVGLLPPGLATVDLEEGTLGGQGGQGGGRQGGTPQGGTPPSSPPAAATAEAGSGPRMVALLAFDDREAAETAVSSIQRRLTAGVSSVTGEAYTARVQPVRVRVIADAPTVLVELGLHRGEADWRRILDDRDLGPMMWGDEPDPD